MTNKREKEVDICYVKRSLGNLGWISRNFFVNALKKVIEKFGWDNPGPALALYPPCGKQNENSIQ